MVSVSYMAMVMVVALVTGVYSLGHVLWSSCIVILHGHGHGHGHAHAHGHGAAAAAAAADNSDDDDFSNIFDTFRHWH